MDLRSKTVKPALVYVEGEFRADRCLEIDADGVITNVRECTQKGCGNGEVVELKNAALVPGFVNAHSHAFHRRLRGRSGIGGAGEENFWVWRENMYKLVQEATFETIQQYCEETFSEMLRAGITCVGEFHYVHHGDSARFELDAAVVEAARRTGIRLVLIVTLYCRSGFDATDVQPEQRRFATQVDELEAHVRRLKASGLPPNVSLAVAAHSLRAVPIAYVRRLAEFARSEGLPLHVHLEEQPKEVADCERVKGARPAALLLSAVEADGRLTAVHCTHTSREHLDEFARKEVNVCVCPLTEGFLGDGIPQLTAADRLCLGTDCNNRLCFWEEMRWLAYCQNMKSNTRNAAALDAHKLLRVATANGARALGVGDRCGELRAGLAADFFVVELDATRLAGVRADELADALVFGAGNAEIGRVFVGGMER